VLAIRLFGHATRLDDLARARWQDWLAGVEDGWHYLNRQCDQIFAIGLSLGGLLALLLSQHHRLAGVVAMSTPYNPPPAAVRLYPLLRLLGLLVRAIPKGRPDWVDRDAFRDRVQYLAYSLQAVAAVVEATQALQQTLPQLTTPTRLIHSRNDRFVGADNPVAILKSLGAEDKSLHWLDRSSHVVTCDVERAAVLAEIQAFITRLTGDPPGPGGTMPSTEVA
jgi:carboxylesterase